jgi:hypothetical protein
MAVAALVAAAGAEPASAAGGPRAEVLALAMRAYHCGRDTGHFENPSLAVVDYSLPSSKPRLWVVDPRTGRVLFEERVAHGRNSGLDRAVAFSNVEGSKQSSLGLYRTDETYVGRHGYSLRLSGLEEGWNDRARERAIVIHGADYVGEEFLRGHGRLGRSWGCPAVRPEVSRALIDRIKDGGAVFVYYPDEDWLESSPFLRCDARVAAR